MPVEARLWYETFRRIARHNEFAEPLRDAAMVKHLGQWTRMLTKAIVETCQNLGWTAVAREQGADVLPIKRQEYLGLDVTAFEGPTDLRKSGWRLPVAVFELENREDTNIVAYSLWKVCVVRTSLRGVFCYQHHTDKIPGLLKALSKSVMLEATIGENTVPLILVLGTRAKAETFPDGFFRPYQWDRQWRTFRGLI